MRIAVIGAGVTGLAVTYQLLRLGHDVRCFEAATPMGARSTGDTRIFRLAHDRPGLVAWAMRARQGWTEWSAAAGELFVGDEGTVVSGDISRTAEAMSRAEAPHQISDEPPPGLPAAQPPGPFLLDPSGGVIRAASTGRFLHQQCAPALVPERVAEVTTTGQGAVTLVTAAGTYSADAVVITAGAGTAALASQVGIDVPSQLVHHARFTYPLREPSVTPPCWLDRSAEVRAVPGDARLSTYGHLASPGRWAIGGHLSLDDTRWDLGREAVTERSLRAVTEHVRHYVTGAVPEPADVVYCDVTPGLGDGLSVVQAGPVTVAWGNNLFKLAPVIGSALARAAVESSLPTELDDVRHPEVAPGEDDRS